MAAILVKRRAAAMTSHVIDRRPDGRNDEGTAQQEGPAACNQGAFAMSVFASPRFLPRVMAVDAASCAATGVLQLVFAGNLARLTGLPAQLLLGTGLFLLAYAAAAAWMAGREEPPRKPIGLVVLGNFGWAAGCIALLTVQGSAIGALGCAWVLAQALTVVVLAELQWMGLRHSRPARHGAMAV
jgi:hypothetical protein